jgi:beta-glucosidase
LVDYKIPTLPSDVRVIDLLKRMTLEEKVAQVVCIWGQKTPLFDESRKLNLNRTRDAEIVTSDCGSYS